MITRLYADMARLIGQDEVEALGLSMREFSWKPYQEIDFRKLNPARVDHLEKLVAPHKGVRGQTVILRDVSVWRRAKTAPETTRPRTVPQFTQVVTEFLRTVPGHRVYKKDENAGTYRCYYVSSIKYHPKKTYDGYTEPEYCSISLAHRELGANHGSSMHFQRGDCTGIPAGEALEMKGYLVENDELRADYLAQTERYFDLINQIGKQCLAIGSASDDMDGNGKSDHSSWWYRNTNMIQLDREGPTRVVIDVFQESEKDRDRSWHYDRSSGFEYNSAFWAYDEDAEERGEVDEDSEPQPIKKIEIPVNPVCAVFDLKRQLRLKLHINQLTEYQYDTAMGDKLVLPQDHLDLVSMLLAHGGEFNDIVGGKGGGAIILCAGTPGTGKTLTAEVFSEARERPLFSVQCSQLGMEPKTLESSLLLVFARAQRWNAILLLDEADVYVRTRGDDLEQNAIVGVFLRVLEYYKGVMFLTTNRDDLVDDAIASRCVAKINYLTPEPVDQVRLWKILSKVAGVEISDKVIEDAVSYFNTKNEESQGGGHTGRDIKNLLKLLKLTTEARKTKVDLAMVKFVAKYKPTETASPYR